ncbi:MAG: hypothetical protein QOH85_891, partial [Acidobacteriaceae bacterium]|nr:hypothetical protein [Acidobacteriaceae bacterium]
MVTYSALVSAAAAQTLACHAGMEMKTLP